MSRGGAPQQPEYAFANAREVQRERLEALQAALDPGTIAELETCGVAPGWRCLEVGAGGGSIAEWLAGRVAPDGAVVATDLDLTVLRERTHPNLEVRVHDVLADDLPAERFDLIHMRLLLAWLPEPRAVLARLLRALKPGGRLVAEEMDFLTMTTIAAPDPRAAEVFERILRGHVDALAARHGFDPGYGLRLVTDLDALGFGDVRCEARASIWRGGSPGTRVWRLSFVQLREALIAGGASAIDVDRAIELCDEPGMVCRSPLLMTARGRAGAATRARG